MRDRVGNLASDMGFFNFWSRAI